MMDNKKIFIVNLAKGKVGEGNANLLGSMLITKIYLASLSRADASPSVLKQLPNYYLYVDEFQSFANRSFADILSEARKYKLNLIMAHQYVEQMEEEVRAAVFGNVGTMLSFRVGAYDAELLEKEFSPVFTATDMVNLGFAQIYLKLMIDGISSQPFSATTLPPIEEPAVSRKEAVLEYSRKTYGRVRSEVEQDIVDWHAPVTHSAADKEGGGEREDRKLPRKNREPAARRTEQKPRQKLLDHPEEKQERNVAEPAQAIKMEQKQWQGQERRQEPVRQKEKTPEEIRLKMASIAQKTKSPEASQKSGKGLTDGDRNELRDTLASVLRDAQVGVAKESAKSEKEELSALKEDNTKPVVEHTKEKPKEIPEEKLRDMLQVKE